MIFKVKKPKLPKETKNWYYYLEPKYLFHIPTIRVVRCECCNKITRLRFNKVGVVMTGYEIKKEKKDSWWHVRKFYKERIVKRAIERLEL